MPNQTPAEAASALLDVILRELAIKFPGQPLGGAVGAAVIELLRAAAIRDERDPVEDLFSIARSVGLQIAALPSPRREQYAEALKREIDAGAAWTGATPPTPH